MAKELKPPENINEEEKQLIERCVKDAGAKGIGYGLSGCLGVYAYKQLVKGGAALRFPKLTYVSAFLLPFFYQAFYVLPKCVAKGAQSLESSPTRDYIYHCIEEGKKNKKGQCRNSNLPVSPPSNSSKEGSLEKPDYDKYEDGGKGND